MNVSRDKDRLLDSDQVAEHFGVTVNAVRRWARDGVIPHFRASHRIMRFRLADVESALAVRAMRTVELRSDRGDG
jgi:predicted site-specific integrase-resolvase